MYKRQAYCHSNGGCHGFQYSAGNRSSCFRRYFRRPLFSYIRYHHSVLHVGGHGLVLACEDTASLRTGDGGDCYGAVCGMRLGNVILHEIMRRLPSRRWGAGAFSFVILRKIRELFSRRRLRSGAGVRKPDLQWTGNAIDLVELIYGIDEMCCINNGNMPLKQLAPLLYKIFGVESKDCYRFYTDIKRRKNESRTYFLDRMQEKLNERMLRDDELDRMRR